MQTIHKVHFGLAQKMEVIKDASANLDKITWDISAHKIMNAYSSNQLI